MSNLDFLASALPSMSEGQCLPVPLSNGTLLSGGKPSYERLVNKTGDLGRRTSNREGRLTGH